MKQKNTMNLKLEKVGGDGKTNYTAEEGNKYTGDYQKETVGYKK